MVHSRGGAAILAVLAVTSSPAIASEIPIDHAGVACVVAERYPRLEARVPAASVARARVHFRPETVDQWYSVEMTQAGGLLVARLPKPKKSLPSFRYYIEVTDPQFATSRTSEFTPVVAATAVQCSGKAQAATETSATVVVLPSPGAPPLPVGFSPAGVTTATATAVTSATAGAAAGGGIGATALVIGGVAVAAGAAVAVTSAGGGGGGDNPGPNPGSPNPSPSPTSPGAPSPSPGNPSGPTLLHVTFEPTPPGLDVSACVGRALIWCCQPVSVQPDGTFNDVWSLNEPNTLRVTGRATATTFDATLTCTSGGPSGSISASGSGADYRGTFDFRGSRGTVTITR